MTAVVTLNGTHNMMMREMQVRFLTTSIVSLLTQCERKNMQFNKPYGTPYGYIEE